ncbi:MAG: peptidylprolyl isomerase [Burkholderiaceae bacterium]|nr:peptidylprolyl isomerase [Burkholderiaceae bacterium]
MHTFARGRAAASSVIHRPLLAAVGAAVLGCALLVGGPALAQNAAVVNGKPIPKARVDEFVEALAAQGRQDSPQLRELVREELIAREIFVQEAEKAGLAKSSEVQRQLETTRQDILIRALIRDHLEKNPVKDEDIKAEYEKLRKEASASGKEYKARHILVDEEDAAKKIIADLDKGEKFEALAEQSKDPGSASNGGDLGWNTASTFVKEFSDAMVALEKGKTVQAPVKTQFGYHVIRLDDVRDASPPPLDQVEPQIQQQLERQRIQSLQKELRNSAKVE